MGLHPGRHRGRTVGMAPSLATVRHFTCQSWAMPPELPLFLVIGITLTAVVLIVLHQLDRRP